MIRRRRLEQKEEKEEDRTDEAAGAGGYDILSLLDDGPAGQVLNSNLAAEILGYAEYSGAAVSKHMNKSSYVAEMDAGKLVVRRTQSLTNRLLKYPPRVIQRMPHIKELYALDPDEPRGFVNMPRVRDFDPVELLPDLEVAYVRGAYGHVFGPHNNVRELHVLLSHYNQGPDGDLIGVSQEDFRAYPGRRTEYVAVHLRFPPRPLDELQSATQAIASLGILSAPRLARVDIHVYGWKSHTQAVLKSVAAMRRNIARNQDQEQPEVRVYLEKDSNNMFFENDEDAVHDLDDLLRIMDDAPVIAPHGSVLSQERDAADVPIVIREHMQDPEAENPVIAEVYISQALRDYFSGPADSDAETEPLTEDDDEDDEDEEKENPMTLEDAKDKLEELRQDRRQYLDNINQLERSFDKMPHAMSYNQAGDAIDELEAQFGDQLDLRDEDGARIQDADLQSDVDADDGDNYSNPDADAYAYAE